MRGLLAIAIILASGCATFEQSAKKTIGATVETVDTAMRAWADYYVSVEAEAEALAAAGSFTKSAQLLSDLKEDEMNVRNAYGDYQSAMQAAEAAWQIYKTARDSGGGDKSSVDRALLSLSESSAAILAIVNAIVTVL